MAVTARQQQKQGLAAAIAAFGLWGFLPLYFHAIKGLSPLDIVAHRIVWSFLLLISILAIRGLLADLWQVMTNRKLFVPLMVSGTLILCNWLIYVWAVAHEHVLAASLGYFLNPLVNVVLGRLVLSEKLTRAQAISVAIAAAGVAALAFGALPTLWISLSLGISFGLYGLIRKMLPVGPLVGLAFETLILMPPCIIWLMHLVGSGQPFFGSPGVGSAFFMIASGIITSLPMLLFAYAAHRLTLSTVGLIQYVAPSTQFIIGVFAFGEPVLPVHMIAFPMIWLALAIYSASAIIAARRSAANQ